MYLELVCRKDYYIFINVSYKILISRISFYYICCNVAAKIAWLLRDRYKPGDITYVGFL